MNNFKRSNFLKEVEVDGIIERDFVHNYWDIFEINRDVRYFTLTREFIRRPDLLSVYLYGSTKYWWLILRINNIDDIWNEMEVGTVLTIPDKNDIDDWLIKAIAASKGV